MSSLADPLQRWQAIPVSDRSLRWHILACWGLLVCGLGLATDFASPVAAQVDAPPLPGFLNKLLQPAAAGESRAGHLLTPADAPLVVTRQVVLLRLTNAYDPSGFRYLAIQLGFRNSGAQAVTVNTGASRLLVGNEEFLRVQKNQELPSEGIDLPGEVSNKVEVIQGTSPLTVPANGKTVAAWLVFTKLPRTRELPPLKLGLDTSTGAIEIDLTQRENEALTSTLERIGPSGRVGIARISGEINALNVPHFARWITQYGEQGVSRLVIAFDKHSRIGDELTQEWLTEGREGDNDRLQFYPQWSSLVRGMVLTNVPGQADESGEYLAQSEAEAVQKVTRDLIPGLDSATLQRESRSGHPLFRRAILLNAGDKLANDDCDAVLELLKSTDPDIQRAAIQSLRAAVAPQAIAALEGIVRRWKREEAALALQSLNASQQPQARELCIQLASDPAIQKHIGLPMILRKVSIDGDERWLTFLKRALESADPILRQSALKHLLQMGVEDRLPLLQTALADKDPQIREMAFEALVARHSADEQSLFVQETLHRVQRGMLDEQLLKALREIRDPSVLPHLLKQIDADPKNSSSQLTSAVVIGGTAILDQLVLRFPQLPPDNRSYLLRVLFFARHSAWPRLAAAGLLDEDSDYSELCQSLLAEQGDAKSIAALAEAIRSCSRPKADPIQPQVNANRGEELARRLGILGGPAALRALEQLQADDNPIQKKLAATGLAYQQYNSPVNPWLQAANRLTHQNDFEGAIQLLNIALEIDPASGRIYNAIGFAQLRMSMGAEAKANFEKAQKLSPEDHNPLTGIAICLALEGRCDEAIAMVDTVPLLFKHGKQQIYLYNVACVYGRIIEYVLKTPDHPDRDRKLEGYRKKAILFLQASVEWGFDDVDLLTSDADLAVLREVPEFKRLPKLIDQQQQ
jgi:HEAT repeat protein